MGGWVGSHIAGRSAYQFLNDYQRIPANSTLNFTGDFSIGITLKPNANQTTYAILHKGDITANPRDFNVNNSLHIWSQNKYLSVQIYINGSTQGFWIQSLNDVMNTSNVTYIELTYNSITGEINLYKDGVSIPFQYIVTGSWIGNPSSAGSLALFNSNTTTFNFGYTTTEAQFEGIVYDALLYKRIRSSVEIANTWSVVQDPNIQAGEVILFTSDRLSSPVRFQLWQGNSELQNSSIFANSATSIYFITSLKSSNNTINNTKLAWISLNNGITIADRNGNNKVTFTNINGDFRIPKFKPDGTEVFYIRLNASNSRYSIYKATLNLSTNVLSNEVLLKTSTNGHYTCIDISPDSTKIIATFNDITNSVNTITQMNIDGTNEIILQSYGVNELLGSVKYNPLGTIITFSRALLITGSTYKYKIFMMNNIGGNLKQLEGDYLDAIIQDFSPDGLHLLYYTFNGFYNFSQLWKMDLTGRNKVQMSHYNNQNDINAVWLPS